MFIAAIMVLLSILAHIRCDLPSNYTKPTVMSDKICIFSTCPYLETLTNIMEKLF
jgi:hypothetical protein